MKKLIYLLIIVLLAGCGKKESIMLAQVNNDGDIVINSAEITNKANIYSYEIDNVKIEILAVKASDGTIRIVFNTCQVCNPSSKAYFIQDGDYIVCQNCGTKIKIDDVGILKHGCNPIPISDENKREDGNDIIISKTLVESYKDKFSNIKRT